MFNTFKKNIDALLFAILGGVWILYYTQYGGLGISPDSINYLSTAEHLASNKGFIQYDEQPFIMFPFCYPIFLSLFVRFIGENWLHIMPFVNAIMYGSLIYFSGTIFTKSNHNRYAKWMLLAILSTSPTLIELYSMLWSESIFALLIIIYVWLGSHYLKKQNLNSLIIWSIVTAIAFDTRFAGLSLVVTGIILILLCSALALKESIVHLFIYGSISIIPVVINLVRNVQVSGTLTGIRQKGVTPLRDNLQYFGEVICNWLPFNNHFQYAWIVTIVFIAFSTSIFCFKIFKKIDVIYERIFVCFTLIYTLFILVTATISKYETLNSRLLSPICVSFVFTIVLYAMYFIDKIYKHVYRWLVQLLFFLFFVLVMIKNLETAKKNFYEVEDWGIGGYSEPSWKESPLIKHLQLEKKYFNGQIPVFSNGSHIIYFFTKKAITIVPERTHSLKVKAFKETPVFYLIWFKNEDNKEVFNLEEIEKFRKLEKLQEFNDGAIYKVSRLAF